jgi:sterol 3beta-glucosyltransferase
MRLYLATIGSRGDFEPFRSLAVAAAQAGHEVHLAHSNDFASQTPTPYTPHRLPGSFEDLLSEGFSFMRSLAQYQKVIKPMLSSNYDTSTSQILSLSPDVVVYHPKMMTAATAAHSVGAVAVRAELVPTLTPTKDFPAAGLPLNLPKRLNRATFSLVAAGLKSFGNPAKKLAQELGVSHIEPDMTVCPVSRALVSQPHDWPANAIVTGPWLTSTTADEDSELDDFLDRGPTIYVGFGSMNDGDAAARNRAATIVAAARDMGYQTLLVTGWGGVSVSDSEAAAADILVRASVHHESVFPKVIAAIHHGGAGTTQRSLQAGTPTVIMPFLADQPWWAERLHDQGLCPPALNKNTTRSERVMAALDNAISRRNTVNTVARAMAGEDGATETVRLLETAVQTYRSQSDA